MPNDEISIKYTKKYYNNLNYYHVLVIIATIQLFLYVDVLTVSYLHGCSQSQASEPLLYCSSTSYRQVAERCESIVYLYYATMAFL